MCGTVFSVKKKLRKKCVNPGVIFGPFGVILGHLGSYLGYFGSFWAFLGHIWPFLGHFVAFLDKFGGKLIFFCEIVGVARLAFRMYG